GCDLARYGARNRISEPCLRAEEALQLGRKVLVERVLPIRPLSEKGRPKRRIGVDVVELGLLVRRLDIRRGLRCGLRVYINWCGRTRLAHQDSSTIDIHPGEGRRSPRLSRRERLGASRLPVE